MVRAAARRIDPATLFAFFATYQDLYWVLDDAQQRQVLALPPSAFDDDRGRWGIVRAEIYTSSGGTGGAPPAYADSARLALEEQVRAAPDDWQRHVLLGLALAYLGRKAEASGKGKRGVELMPISRDGYFGPYNQLQLVRIYLLTGEPELALDQLEPLLRIPFYLSPDGSGSIRPSIRCGSTRAFSGCSPALTPDMRALAAVLLLLGRPLRPGGREYFPR